MEAPSYKVRLAGVNKGCRFNNMLLVKIKRFLEANGHEVVSDADEPDYILVHSCGVFDGFTSQTLELSRKYTSEAPQAKVLLIGCLDKIHTDAPQKNADLDFVGDTDRLNEIFARKSKLDDFSGHSTQEAIDETLAYPQLDTAGRVRQNVTSLKNRILRKIFPQDSRFLAILGEIERDDKRFVEIARGCVGNCTYCIEKRVNPEVVSRPIDEILDDIAQLYEPGIKLCLAADDCGAYGIDISETIFSLNEAIQERFPDLAIELCNIYPMWVEKFEDEYVAMLQDSNIVSINIPIQSGSQRIVDLMNRKYSLENVLRIVRKLKAASPDALIWTHFILGFPGETREAFKASLALMPEFDYCFWFTYSAVGGTPSTTFDGRVPERTKKWRNMRFRTAFYTHLIRTYLHELKPA